jgi:Mg-chelatase subunit ChlD
VPYHRIIEATRATFERIGNSHAPRQFVATVTCLGGATASINWHPDMTTQCTVNMPTIAPHALLSRAEADRMVAFLIHELQHALRTDRPEWRRVVEKRDTLLRDTVNALEDCRIEAAGIIAGTIPGARALWSELDETLLLQALAGGYAPRDVGAMPYALAVLGRQALGEHDTPSAARLHDMLPAWSRPAIANALTALARCQSTKDVHLAAMDFCLAIRKAAAKAETTRQHAKPKPKPKGQQGQQGQDKGQQGQDKGQQGQQGQDEDQQGQQGQQGPQGQQGQDESLGGKGARICNPTRERTHEATPDPMASLMDSIKDRNGEDAMPEDDDKQHRRVAALSDWRGHSVAPAPQDINPIDGENARAGIPNPGALKAKIRLMLRSPGRIDHERRLTTGRLDRRSLSRAAIGARDVFSQRHDTPSVEVGVILLLDNSGSMESRTIPTRTMAVHLADACDSAGARCMVATFGAADYTGRAQLIVLKDWNVKGAKADASIARLDAIGGTPLSECIMASAEHLARQPHLTRRIVIALTDGLCNVGPRGVRWAGSFATQHGVELIGIGLGINMAKVGFRHGITVASAADLTGRALALLQKALQGTAQATR